MKEHPPISGRFLAKHPCHKSSGDRRWYYTACRKAQVVDLYQAAREVGIHHFIKHLDGSEHGGYNSTTGQSVKPLSGGEHTLIQLLRLCTLPKPPPIIILDEPNSALDTITEGEILGKILRRFKDSTVIVMTHKLKAIQGAQLILCLKDGRIEESGTHEGLLEKQNGCYAELWAKQYSTNAEE